MSAAGKPGVTERLATSPRSRSSRIAMTDCIGSVVVHCQVIGMMNGIWRNALCTAPEPASNPSRCRAVRWPVSAMSMCG